MAEAKSRSALLADQLTSLASRFGTFASDAIDEEDRSTSFLRMPSLGMNYSWGGGLALERMHLFIGGKHSGKSTATAMAMAAMQKICRNCYREFRTVHLGPGADVPTVEGEPFIPSECFHANPASKKHTVNQLLVSATDPELFARIICWRWRTSKVKNAVVAEEQWRDPNKKKLGKVVVVSDLTLEEDDCGWTPVVGDHVVEMPFCDCMATGKAMPIIPSESEKNAKARLDTYRFSGNSYSETTCLYLDAEDKVDLNWWKCLTVIVERVTIVRMRNGEDAVDLVTAAIESGLVDFIVVDSIEYLEPDAQVEASQHDGGFPLGAKMINGALRKWVIKKAYIRQATGRAPTMILINQIRKNTQGHKVLPKGMGQEFAPSTITEFWTSDVEVVKDKGADNRNIDDEKRTDLVSKRVNFRPTKCCSGPPEITGSFILQQKPVLFRGKELIGVGQVNDLKYVYQSAQTYGLIVSDNGWKLVSDDRTFRIEADLKEYLMSDPMAFRRLSEQTLQAMFEARKLGVAAKM